MRAQTSAPALDAPAAAGAPWFDGSDPCPARPAPEDAGPPAAGAAPYVLEYHEPQIRALTEQAARAYFKAHSVAGDARFMLAAGRTLPADLRAAWAALGAAVAGRTSETAADRKTAAGLRDAWRRWTAGQPYALPRIEAPTRRAPATGPICPTCGRGGGR